MTRWGRHSQLGLALLLLWSKNASAFVNNPIRKSRAFNIDPKIVSFVTTDRKGKTDTTVRDKKVSEKKSNTLKPTGIPYYDKIRFKGGENTVISSAAVNGINTSIVDSTIKNSPASMAAEDLTSLIEEINNRFSNGTADLLRNLTDNIDARLGRLPQKSATEFSEYVYDLTRQIQLAQQDELRRQLAGLEKRFIEPLETIAFDDAPLFRMKSAGDTKGAEDLFGEYERDIESGQLILMGENSTLPRSRKMRTNEIMRNFNVAPFYYSIALLNRWVKKASYPSLYLMSLYRGLGSLVKSNTKASRRDHLVGGENLQSGWKRTGEIAAKGSFAKKWAILRRSAEIWAYFSSFYVKDRRISAKYNSGRWSEERYNAERSKLGREITNNLLKLGPVSYFR
jgi:hypothetical protein